MLYTRRDVGKVALAALPVAKALAAPNSKFGGVQIGVVTYSFRQYSYDVDEIIKAMVKLGINEVELMSESAESGADAPRVQPPRPAGGGRPTQEQMAAMRAWRNSPEAQKAREDLRKWRMSVSKDTFKPVRKKFNDAGIKVELLCYNMGENIADDEIEYAFQMARSLGVKAFTTSTKVSVAKRVAPFADKHKILVGYHGHDNTADPNEFATLESFATAMSYSKYNGANLDIGHFTASNYDPIPYIREHWRRLTNLHLKDRKKNHGPNMPWGQGETPIKEVLQMVKKEKYPLSANIEYEYRGESDPVTEVGKCLQYCKEALA